MKKLLLAAAAMGLLYSGVQAQQISDRKLIAHYELNGNALDQSANGLNGTGFDLSPAADRFNNPTGATAFNGTSSYILISDDNKLEPTDSLTVTAWVYQLTKPNTGWNPVISRRYAFVTDPYASFELSNHSDLNFKWVFNISSGQPGSLLTPTSTQSSSFGQWKFIAGVFDGSTVKLYINGMLDTTVSKTTPIGYSNLDMYIGYNGTGPNEYFRGRLDDIRIYGRALTAAEISTLYNPSATGLNKLENELPKLSVYPNPVENTLNFSENISAIQIFTTDGRLAFIQNELNGNTIDISNLKQGIYYAQVMHNNKMHISKFIKN